MRFRSNQMRELFCLGAVLSCLLGTSQVASACSCELAPDTQAELRRSAFVFAGTVIEIDEQPADEEILGPGAALIFTTFRVSRSWKGVEGEETTVLTWDTEDGSVCGYRFELDEDYLVYGYTSNSAFGAPVERLGSPEVVEFLQTNSCFRTQPLGEAAGDVTALGDPVFTVVRATHWGQIKVLCQ